jgi:hypothetical protein
VEQPVEVREDPRIDVSPDVHRAWGEFHREIAALARRFAPVADRIRRAPGTDAATLDRKRQAQELLSRIGGLYGAVGSWTGAPTADQRSRLAYYQRMATELETAAR